MIKHNVNKKLIWHISNRGFGSEINNLLYAINYCNKKNYDLILEDSLWNFRIKKGWSDYFVSLDHEINFKKHRVLRATLFILDKYIGLYKFTYYEKNRVGLVYLKNKKGKKVINLKVLVYLIINQILNIIKPKHTKIFFDSFEEVRKHSLIELERNKRQFIEEINKILKKTWKLNSNFSKKIANKKTPIDENYAVFHIRRGDKVDVGEDNFYDVSAYMKRLREINSFIKTVFVMSDDYTTFIDLNKRYPTFNFLTLIDEKEKGHLQDRFNQKTINEKEVSAINLLTEIEIAKECKIFIESKKSNLFRLIEYFKLDNCYDISFGKCDFIL